MFNQFRRESPVWGVGGYSGEEIRFTWFSIKGLSVNNHYLVECDHGRRKV